MKELNHRLLTLARESRGLTQSQLALNVKSLNQGNLSKMEQGILNIPVDILNEIAHILNYPKSFFYKSLPKIPVHSFYYRKRLTIPKKISMIVDAKIDLVRMIVSELLKSVDIPEYTIPEIDVTEKGTPLDAARFIRTVLNINKGPINEPVSILERNGVIVVFLKIETEKFDGITVFTDDERPIIIINENMPNDRKRFTIGHELGHLVMHLPFRMFREPENLELEANKFSAEYNMPEIECRNDLLNLKYNNLASIKEYWNLSKAAIIYRAKDIGTINLNTYQYLNIELGRRGEKKQEQINVPIDKPKIVNELLRLHQSDLGYSNVELEEILGVCIQDFDELFNRNRRILRIA